MAKDLNSVPGPDGEVVQLEYMPCGQRRCDKCWEGLKGKDVNLKASRSRKSSPEGHGPYYRIYTRRGGKLTARTVRRDEESALEAMVGEDLHRLRPLRWSEWREQPDRENQIDRSSARRGPLPGTPKRKTRPDEEYVEA